MAIALIVTLVLGVVLAFRSLRQRWLVWLSLGLGVLFPILFLWLGQRRWLILRTVRVPHLASAVLSEGLRVLQRD